MPAIISFTPPIESGTEADDLAEAWGRCDERQSGPPYNLTPLYVSHLGLCHHDKITDLVFELFHWDRPAFRSID